MNDILLQIVTTDVGKAVKSKYNDLVNFHFKINIQGLH